MFQFTVLAITAAMVCLDQVTKWLAVLFLKNAEAVTVIPSVLGFTYVENRGAAFGILQGQRWLFLMLTSVIMIAILGLVLFGKFRAFRWFNVSATLIVAGGIGNFIDRLIQGYVVDFIQVQFFDFPVFNVADCYVVVGSVLLLIFFFFLYDEHPIFATPKAEESHGEDTTDHTN